MEIVVCSSCQFGNFNNAKYCQECGSELKRFCPGCTIEYPVNANFCQQCGARLEPRAFTSTTSSAPPSTITSSNPVLAVVHTVQPDPNPARPMYAGERRQLTVMFCDVIGSTALSEKHDPEVLHNVYNAYHEVSARVIQRYGGHIAKYLGDGLLNFFGYPHAHEDDADRAVRAGLELLDELRRLNVQLMGTHGLTLAIRVGIHTGLVVAGEIGGDGQKVLDVVGETPNIAARLQEVAEPNTLVVSGTTYRMIANHFESETLGDVRLKGLTRQIEVYRILKERDHHTAHMQTQPTLVGRRDELALLQKAWKEVLANHARVVVLGGEAGIGKTRLVQAICTEAATHPDTMILTLRSSVHHQSSPFHPIIAAFQYDLIQFRHDDTPAIKLTKLEDFLEQRGYSLSETVPLLAALLSVPLSNRYSPLNLSLEGFRKKTLDLLVHLVKRHASLHPLVFVLENAHWTDPSTLELLRQLMEQIVDASMLTLITHRPNFHFDFPPHPHIASIVLDRLEDDKVALLIRHLAKDKELPEEVIAQIVQKTDGVPLFIEETTRTLLESGALQEYDTRYELVGSLPELLIPTTLNDSLMARLDRLSNIKTVAQTASVLGREFNFDLLQAISGEDEIILHLELQRLVKAELLVARMDDEGNHYYRFRHALIQDAAYNSLLRSRRQQYHLRVASALAERFQEIAQDQPEVIASHYTFGGDYAKAIAYWMRAGQNASAKYANQEAVIHFEKALELLAQQKETPERIQTELVLQTSIGVVVMLSRGFAVNEVKTAFSRARDLCNALGNPPQLFPIRYRLLGHDVVSARLERAYTEAMSLLRTAEATQEPTMLIVGHFICGNILLWFSELKRSQQHLETAISLYDRSLHQQFVDAYGEDFGVNALCYLSLCYLHMGLYDRAVQRIEEAVKLAEELDHPFSFAWASGIRPVFYYWRRDLSRCLETAEIAITYCSERGFPFFLGTSLIYRGWVYCSQGNYKEGIAIIERSIDMYKQTGSELLQPFLLSILAEAFSIAGRASEGLSILDIAIEKAQQNREVIHEVNLYRLRGKLRLEVFPQNVAEAEEDYRRAWEIAHRLGAHGYGLQINVALSRLLIDQGNLLEARTLLGSAMSHLNEGFDLPDYQEARQLHENIII